MKRILLLFLSFSLFSAEENEPSPSVYELSSVPSYSFKGVHYMASYYGCDHEKLTSKPILFITFGKAVKRTGATIIRCYHHGFGEESMTAIALLSESHATIHTYPEYDNVFVDIFTCGDNCDWRKFESTLVDYLKPKKIRRKVRCRK